MTTSRESGRRAARPGTTLVELMIALVVLGLVSTALTTAIVRHPDLAEGVLEYCASHPVSLIAMATRGRGGVERAVLGSVTDAVLHKTQLPILVVATHSDKGGKEVA